jgi:hypothetical protein
MTYDELVTQVNDYIENSFPVDNINTFIRQAEQRIYNTVQLASLRKNVTGTSTVGNKYLQCPSDFLSVYSIAVISDSEYLYLLNKDVNFIREAYPSTATAFRGKPKHYAIFGPRSDSEDYLSFILGPTPDASYEIELHYFYLPESIVDAADGHTWLGDNFDSALLYGTLMEAATYTKAEQDMVQLYNERYVQAIALLKNLGDGKQRADAYRDGQVRVQVS